MKTLHATIEFGGFYCSVHDGECDRAVQPHFEDGHGSLPPWFNDVDINWKLVHETYAKLYLRELAEWILDEYEIDITFKFTEISSPREYNFATDKIHADCDMKLVNKLNAKLIDDADFMKYLEYNTQSRSGFMSFYSLAQALANKDHILHVYVFQYLCRKHQDALLMLMDNNLYESLCGLHFYTLPEGVTDEDVFAWCGGPVVEA